MNVLTKFVKMIVVPQSEQINNDVAREFFKRTLGSYSKNDSLLPERILAAFMAISSFGNIVVMNFLASRGTTGIADNQTTH